MKNYKSLLIVLILLITINGCEEDDNQAIKGQDVLMPLAIGNTWIFKHTLLDSNNQVEEVSYDTLSILKDTIINAETLFGSNHDRFYRNNSWGLETYYDTYSNTSISAINCYQFPTNLNNSWVLYTLDYPDSTNGNSDSVKVVNTTSSIDTLISVPKGKFNCIGYKQSLIGVHGFPFTLIQEVPSEPVEIFFSKNIGIVKAEYMIPMYNSYRKKHIVELFEYTLH